MKKLILTFSILLAGLVTVNAQNKIADKATKMVNKLTEVCGLTADQVAKIQPIAEAYVKTREANKQQYANDPVGLKAANKKSNQSYKAQLQTILTPDQQQKLKDYLAQQKANRQNSKASSSDEGGEQQ